MVVHDKISFLFVSSPIDSSHVSRVATLLLCGTLENRYTKFFAEILLKFENFKLFSAHLHPNLKSLANDRSQHLVKDHHACLYCLSNARPRHLQTHHQANLCVGQAIQSLKDIYYAVEKSCPVGSYIGGAYFFSKV